jgi:PAS domain S-box-containing protein
VWAEHAPEHFANRAALIAAEIARLEGRDLDAESSYEEAIRLAREHGFDQNQGIANELAARFHAAHGRAHVASACLRAARDCYVRWGAEGKVRQLEQLHPQLRQERRSVRLATTLEARPEQLDLDTVVKMSQTLSGEIVLDKLIRTLMRIAIEHAGADRGLLLLERTGEQRIEAEATTDPDKAVRLLRTRPTPVELPLSVLQHVIGAQESVILDDACADNPFSGDEYIRKQRPRSLLCLALVKQARLIGVLYLENRLASHVFTPARYSVLNLLSSQAAISLENARLYADLAAENLERRRTDAALRQEAHERERAEQLARMDEMRFRRFFDLPLIGMAVTSPERRFLEVNDKLCEILGYPREQLIGRDWASITHPDDLADNLGLLQQAMGGASEGYSMDKRYIHRDGHIVHVSISVCCVRRTDGTPDHFVLTVQDVTARYQVQEQLQLTEAHLKHAQQVARIASYEAYPPEFFTSEWSEEMREIFGLAPGAPVPKRDEYIDRMVHPDDREYMRRAFQVRGTADRRSMLEYRVVRPDGSVRYLQTIADPLMDSSGRTVQLVGTILDVTERKLATERLEMQTALLDQLFQSVAEGTVLLDLDDRVLRVNTEFTAMFGYTAEEALGRDISELVVPPEMMAEFAVVTSHLARGQVFDAETVRRRRDGSRLQVSILRAPIFSGGRQIASYAIYRDITERKRVTEELQEAQAELAHVARITTLGELAASIAHEINQPLSGIITNATTCLRMLAADPPNVAGARETARRSLRDGNRAADVITRLRALIGKKEVAMASLDLNEATREVIALALSELHRDQVLLRVELDDDLPHISGDRVQLQQVILNLMLNAADAMSSVDDRPRELTVRTERDGRSGARLSVRDAGVGFDAQAVDKLFQPFYTTKPEGMGIGLSVSRSIVARHGGRLWAEANDGPGATFLFSIPGESQARPGRL